MCFMQPCMTTSCVWFCRCFLDLEGSKKVQPYFPFHKSPARINTWIIITNGVKSVKRFSHFIEGLRQSSLHSVLHGWEDSKVQSHTCLFVMMLQCRCWQDKQSCGLKLVSCGVAEQMLVRQTKFSLKLLSCGVAQRRCWQDKQSCGFKLLCSGWCWADIG